MDDFLCNWVVCMSSRPAKVKKIDVWSPPSFRCLKFNVDGAARGKPRLVGIGGVLRNHKGEVLFLFSKHVFFGNDPHLFA